jgi:hypothetical protein
VVSHCVLQTLTTHEADPHAIWNGTTTRIPDGEVVTSAPVSSTSPITSWPEYVAIVENGPITSYRWRSDPQIPVDVTLITASVDCSIRGSGTSPYSIFRFPCQVKRLHDVPVPTNPPVTRLRIRRSV